MAPFNGIDTFQILRHFPLNHDLWEKRIHQFSNENLQKPHLQLLEVLLFASFHLLPHNVHFGTTRSPHPLTWTSCWVSRWRNRHGIPGVKLLFVSGKGKIQIIFVGSFWKQKKCTKPNDCFFMLEGKTNTISTGNVFSRISSIHHHPAQVGACRQPATPWNRRQRRDGVGGPEVGSRILVNNHHLLGGSSPHLQVVNNHS